MNERNSMGAMAHGLACFLGLGSAPLALTQRDDRVARLQSDALARIVKWSDHVRSTGDARSTVSELSTAQAELNAALNRFLQVKDYAGAAWSAINLADILCYVNQWAEAIPIYKQADEWAQNARRPDYETKALARMAFSEMKVKQLDEAADHAQKAVSLGQNCGNPDFYFDALLTAGEVEATRSNLPAASDYVDRALAIVNQLSDKQQFYLVYGDRADIYYQKAFSYDCQKQPDISLQSYDHARADYQVAQSIAQKLGYTFLVQNFSQEIQTAEGQAPASRGRGKADHLFPPGCSNRNNRKMCWQPRSSPRAPLIPPISRSSRVPSERSITRTRTTSARVCLLWTLIPRIIPSAASLRK